jgi:3-oxoacyl-[acyl-carrier protein] reductase
MLKDKVILITGSSRGIGAATAKLAVAYGARVVLHGRTETPTLKQLASELNSPYIFCDVGNENDVNRVMDGIGSIDVLVNSAGVNLSQPFMDQSTQSWETTYNVNVLGSVNFSKAVLLQMRERGRGKIINVASIRGYSATTGSPAYAASKAAIIALTASMAREFAPNILVNAVAPGYTNTDMTEESLSDRIRDKISKIPLSRMARPEEIAEVILFLASDKASYITGQTIKVSGGL